MNEMILNVVRFNEQIDFTILIPLAIIYLLAFWLIVSIWVFLDSKTRYGNKKKAILLAFLNQLFGLPFLLLYILARPFVQEELTENDNSNNEKGGVNVPIVNFIGKQGVVMSLELRINSVDLASAGSSEMTVDVTFNPADEQKVLVEKSSVVKDSKANEMLSKKNNAGFAGKLMSIFKRSKKIKLEVNSDNTIVPSELESSIIEEIKPVVTKKKKNKKRKR